MFKQLNLMFKYFCYAYGYQVIFKISCEVEER